MKLVSKEAPLGANAVCQNQNQALASEIQGHVDRSYTSRPCSRGVLDALSKGS